MASRNPAVKIYSLGLLYAMLSCWTTSVRSQSCLPCDESACSLNTSTCSYGVVKDYCDCCDECLKGPGESCGGIFGKCEEGSRCYVKLEYGVPYVLFAQTTGRCEALEISPSSSLPPSTTMASSVTTSSYSVLSSSPSNASCQPASKSLSPSPTSTPVPSVKCRTPCSREFCADGRNRYCSSNTTSSQPRNIVEERTPCQHTTCLACRVHVKPKCPTCPKPVTKRCLRHFYLCLNEHYMRDDIFLGLSDPRAMAVVGDVICDVPYMDEPEDGSGES